MISISKRLDRRIETSKDIGTRPDVQRTAERRPDPPDVPVADVAVALAR
jgi:hypothetical protein